MQFKLTPSQSGGKRTPFLPHSSRNPTREVNSKMYTQGYKLSARVKMMPAIQKVEKPENIMKTDMTSPSHSQALLK